MLMSASDLSTAPKATFDQAYAGLTAMPGMMGDAVAYWVDACQRGVLFWDVLRKRGNAFLDHRDRGKPPVLGFDYEVIVDGRALERPCNYLLLRILPEPEVETDEDKRPFVIVDPRAGHGPGIGGFKADSQVGIALRNGHPCYFVSFLPEPVEGQTIADIGLAEAAFLRKVTERHPKAPGKPVVIGNCQAGWAITLMSAVAPDLVGPIALAGSPLSYWAGVEGENPMRYLGGLTGGSWLASLAGDLGHGKFDGAYLVENFERLNPANSYWSKLYDLYAKVDTEEERFLDFERWWGGFFLMNAEELAFIVNELFIGNKLTAGGIQLEDGRRIDVRNIKAPIIVFCSHGDNITPPAQALHWIAELYDSVDEIRAREQTIVYALHEDIGHLGIFVSGKVAKKEHAEIVSNIDLIDTLPPGLYEATFECKDPNMRHAELVSGDYITRFEARTIDDIKALGGVDPDDEMRFGTVARVSAINEGLYRTFLQPWLRLWSNEATAQMMRELHPLRLQRKVFSDLNPMMRPLETMAESVRANRKPVRADNPFLSAQNAVSAQIVAALDGYRDARDLSCEKLFQSVYDSPALQAAVGLRAAGATPRPKKARDEAHEALVEKRMAALRPRIDEGGLIHAVVRGLIYVAMEERLVDERGFAMLRKIGETLPPERRPGLAAFKEIVKEQDFMLMLDEERALVALPKLVPEMAERRQVVGAIRRIASVRAALRDGRADRLRRIARLLEVEDAEAGMLPAKATA